MNVHVRSIYLYICSYNLNFPHWINCYFLASNLSNFVHFPENYLSVWFSISLSAEKEPTWTSNGWGSSISSRQIKFQSKTMLKIYSCQKERSKSDKKQAKSDWLVSWKTVGGQGRESGTIGWEEEMILDWAERGVRSNWFTKCFPIYILSFMG